MPISLQLCGDGTIINHKHVQDGRSSFAVSTKDVCSPACTKCKLNPDIMHVKARSSIGRGREAAHVAAELWEDGQALFLVRITALMDGLERLIQSEPLAKNLLSSYITREIGDLSIVSQCLNQLTLYMPWARNWEDDLVHRQDKLKEEFVERSQPWARMLNALYEASGVSRIISLGEPSGGKFAYPVAKRRTKENVEALRRAEGHLDAFLGGH